MSFFLKRMAHNWQILLTLALGVILGTGILASGPLLVDTVINFSLPYKLRDLDPLATNLRITIYSKLDAPKYQALDSQVEVILNRRLSQHIAQVDSLAASTWMYPWVSDQAMPDQRMALSYYESLPERVNFIAGGWAAGPALQNDVLQVVISEAFANYYGLQVGDQLPVSTKQSAVGPDFSLSIGGIVRPNEARERYWLGKYSRLQNLATGKWTAEFYAFVPQEQFIPITTQLFTNANIRLDWNVVIDPTSFRVVDTSDIRSQVNLLREDLKELPNAVHLETKLDQMMQDFFARAQIIRITMYVLIGEVLFLTLYYISMVASLSIQQIEGEFSTLSSRGASYSQLLQIQSTQVINIGILALTFGPLLALAMVWSLAKLGPLADIAPQGWSISFPSTGWIAAGFSVAVCVTGMIFPIGSAVKRSIVAYSRTMGRTERPQWWQRIYLDVFILVIGLLLLWRWRFYGSLASGIAGGRVDWLLILSPLVLLIGSAIILLRILPPVLKITSRLAARGRNISTTLALWQTSRYPAHVARLVLLLTLAMALGILTTGINATLDLSEYERALYAVGSDLRMHFNGFIPLKEINNSPGLEAMSVVWRGNGSSSVRYHDVIPSIEILAVEPYSFSKVTRYRDDYSNEPMGELLGMMAPDPETQVNAVIPLPGKPGQLGTWVLDARFENIDQLQFYNRLDELLVYAKLQTADGQLFVVKLSRVIGPEFSEEKPGWNYFVAELPALEAGKYPLAFHSFWSTIRPMGPMPGSVDMIWDDFLVIDAESEEEFIFEGFDEINQIWQAKSRNSRAAYINIGKAHTGTAALAYSLPYQFNPFGHGLMPAITTRSEPLPALVSNEFINLTKAAIGDEIKINIQSIPTDIRIAGVINYFPTLFDSPGHAFVILPRDAMLMRLNRETRNAIYANEIWLDTIDVQAANQIQTNTHVAIQTWDLDSERLTLKADALLLGLRSVTFLAYILTTILSLVGFSTHFYLNARQRELQFSILRSLGLSAGQMYTWLLLEQVIMVITGLTLGMLFGLLLNRLILPGLPITIGDRPAIPPFFPLEDWIAVLRLYTLLLVAFMVSLGIATAMLWRANIHRALRIGQE